MARLSCFKYWMIKNRNRILLVTIVSFMTIGCIYISKLPRYAQVYKYLLNADVSMTNDDLKGALVSLEKAHELIPSESLETKIEEVNKLIDSKSSFIRGIQAEEGQHFETAYYYYERVAVVDEERYQIAQEKLPTLANKAIDQIYEQADKYYESHLYLIIIGKLKSALKYNIRIEETESKIKHYQETLYQYYVDKSIDEAKTYYDDPNFYNLFVYSLDDALKYVTSDHQKEAVVQLKDKLIQMNIDYYLNLATQAYEIGDNTSSKQYIKRILMLDPSNQAVLFLLEQLSLDK